MGTDGAANVRVRVELAPGLTHDSGVNPLEYDLGPLLPGARKTMPLIVKPVKPGKFPLRVSALVNGQVLGQVEQVLQVNEAGLALKLTGPAVRYVGQEATWALEVANNGGQPLVQVALSDVLPPELDFVKADGSRLLGREVVWNVDRLEPKAVKTFQLTTRANRMTARTVSQARATAYALETDPGPGAVGNALRGVPVSATGALPTGWPISSQAQADIAIEGLPAFKMKVDARGPIEVGERTEYAITVSNTGSLPGSGIQVVCEVPAQLQVLGASPGGYRLDGQKVVFPPLPTMLDPGRAVQYRIAVLAVKAGDARFRAELSSSILKQPVVKEHSLTVSEHQNTPPAVTK